ncbi:hypothetical protein CBR_g20401 [Chara braunii]|uniref:Embryonic stem cell-specific 5-hydroxymethylcytosine-binding protein n=1 Tax=Chara braunii TaxID=69332 RepID=A0A388JUB7_CHABU|nr:hypothetical protein CBR_g20401 [Chara braunii]|eukprot:GBG61370.1 hypothetical protein CBR_g20401 [Chara braunii]
MQSNSSPKPNPEGDIGKKEDSQRVVQCMKWGLIPSFTRKSEKPDHYRMFNARGESLHEKASFRRLIARCRCVAMANGFYEWKKDGSKKQPYYIHLKDESLLHFAALFDCWEDHEGRPLLTYTIVTTRASKSLEWLHDRMPVILRTEASVKSWLEDELSAAQIVNMAVPYNGPDLTWYRVTPSMGKPSFDGVECIQELKTPSKGMGALAMMFKRQANNNGGAGASEASLPKPMGTPSEHEMDRSDDKGQAPAKPGIGSSPVAVSPSRESPVAGSQVSGKGSNNETTTMSGIQFDEKSEKKSSGNDRRQFESCTADDITEEEWEAIADAVDLDNAKNGSPIDQQQRDKGSETSGRQTTLVHATDDSLAPTTTNKTEFVINPKDEKVVASSTQQVLENAQGKRGLSDCACLEWSTDASRTTASGMTNVNQGTAYTSVQVRHLSTPSTANQNSDGRARRENDERSSQGVKRKAGTVSDACIAGERSGEDSNVKKLKERKEQEHTPSVEVESERTWKGSGVNKAMPFASPGKAGRTMLMDVGGKRGSQTTISSFFSKKV